MLIEQMSNFSLNVKYVTLLCQCFIFILPLISCQQRRHTLCVGIYLVGTLLSLMMMYKSICNDIKSTFLNYASNPNPLNFCLTY